MKRLKAVCMSVLWVLCASTFGAHANLIVNGSFEDSYVKRQSWKWFTSDKVLGWEGSNIEIWHQLQNFDAYYGNQHIELNAHGQKGQPYSIHQTFDTQRGERYDFSFAYSARRSLDEAFKVSIFSEGKEIQSRVIDDHQIKQWSTFESQFLATATSAQLVFTSLGNASSTYGNFIDDIRVVQSVNAPATMAVLAPVAFALLIVQRRRLKQKMNEDKHCLTYT